MSSSDNNIKVIARFRPPNSLEKASGGDPIVDFEPDEETSVGVKVKTFFNSKSRMTENSN